jgi:hypothetical protein
MRQLISVIICVALLVRWQARPSGSPFRMLLKVIIYQSPLLIDLWETPGGAAFNVKYSELLGGGGWSGTLTTQELRAFQAGLESHGAWTETSQPGPGDRIVLMLTQGERHRRMVMATPSQLGNWLFDQKGLMITCLERSTQSPD